MDNNEKIRNKSFLDNQKQKSNILKVIEEFDLVQIFQTDIIYLDDYMIDAFKKNLSKIRKNVKENINSHLQKYSTFDN